MVDWSIDELLGVEEEDRVARKELLLNPFCAVWLSYIMDTWIGPAAFVTIWIVLQIWVLPRLGVRT